MKHQLQLDKDGQVDDFAFEFDEDHRGHNGPRCIACGEVWCMWCEKDAPWLADDCGDDD